MQEPTPFYEENVPSKGVSVGSAPPHMTFENISEQNRGIPEHSAVVSNIEGDITMPVLQHCNTTTTPVPASEQLQEYFQENVQNFNKVHAKGFIGCYYLPISDTETQSTLSKLIAQKGSKNIVVTRNDNRKYKLRGCKISNNGQVYECYFEYDKNNKLQSYSLKNSSGEPIIDESEKMKY